MKTALLIVCGVLYGLTALLMLGAVLLQESKGGGLAALGGTRAESAFGASNPLRRLTVVLSISFFVLASVLAIALKPPPSVTERVSGDKPVVTPEEPAGVEATVPVPGADKDKDKDKDKSSVGTKPEEKKAPEKKPDK